MVVHMGVACLKKVTGDLKIDPNEDNHYFGSPPPEFIFAVSKAASAQRGKRKNTTISLGSAARATG